MLRREGGISLETPQWKRTSSRIEGKISWIFSSCGIKIGIPLELRWGPQGPSHGGLGNVQSPCELRGASRDSAVVAARPVVLIWSWGNLRFALPCRHGSQSSSGVSTGESGRISCGDMHVHSPLELEKQRQASSQVDIRISGFLSRCHRSIIPATVF